MIADRELRRRAQARLPRSGSRNRIAPRNSPGVVPITGAVVISISLFGVGCSPDAILHPAATTATGIAPLLVAVSSAGGTRAAVPDAAHVQVFHAAGVLFDSTVAFPPTSSEVRLRLELRLAQDTQTVTVIVDLLEAGRIVESGAATVKLRQGQTTSAPIQIGGEILFRSISAGTSHACGITTSGFAYCWGRNDFGQLGDGSTIDRVRPVAVNTAETFVEIGAGVSHTCALTSTQRVLCWGGNQSGQLGSGNRADRSSPGVITGGATYTTLAVSGYASCARVPAGAVYCWGAGGRVGVDLGALGATAPETCVGYYAGDWPCSTIPLLARGGTVYATLVPGLWFACSLTLGKRAVCWGWNSQYQLGNGTFTDSPGPVAVPGQLSFDFFDAGAAHGCAIETGGAGYCWGARSFNNGQLGDGTFTSTGTPTRVAGGLSFRTLRPSKGNDIFAHTCGVTTGDVAYCWGINQNGQLGAKASQTCQGTGGATMPCDPAPVRVDGGLAFSDVSTGAEFTCGVTTTGAGYCWGWNNFGQLGNGTTTNAAAPVRVVR